MRMPFLSFACFLAATPGHPQQVPANQVVAV
jgi:hypothetical protein